MPLYKITSNSREEKVQAMTIILACAIFKAKYRKDKIISVNYESDS